jgi:hypothetical protein
VHAEIDTETAIHGLGFLDRFGDLLPEDQAVAEREEPHSLKRAEPVVFVLEAGGASDQPSVLVDRDDLARPDEEDATESVRVKELGWRDEVCLVT